MQSNRLVVKTLVVLSAIVAAGGVTFAILRSGSPDGDPVSQDEANPNAPRQGTLAGTLHIQNSLVSSGSGGGYPVYLYTDDGRKYRVTFAGQAAHDELVTALRAGQDARVEVTGRHWRQQKSRVGLVAEGKIMYTEMLPDACDAIEGAEYAVEASSVRVK